MGMLIVPPLPHDLMAAVMAGVSSMDADPPNGGIHFATARDFRFKRFGVLIRLGIAACVDQTRKESNMLEIRLML
jgi:hypothetical protein